MANRKPSPAQIRDRRARIAAVVLSLGLLAVGGIQGPKLLKLLSGSPTANATQTTTSTPTGATASGAPGAVVATPGASTGQIHGFALFSPQDPFHSQLPSPTVAAASAPSKPAATTPVPTAATKQAGAPPVTFTTTAPLRVVAFVLKINGKRALIGIGGTFPKKAPLFRFASLAGKRLRIGVVGGSFADGRPFLMLQAGREVTLLDESVGTRFVIRFVKMTHALPSLLTSPVPIALAGTPGAVQPTATPLSSKTTPAG
jgi:hypothetical protein